MTFRVILRKDVIYKNNTSPLCLLFFHDNRKKSVGLGVSVAREYWDAESQKVMDNCPNRDDIQFQITAKIKEY
uniref:Arm DNA-binding domain-containing protein n=1 Tax=uncultured Alistipes sp. TaxID=538949 RepID=UPI00261C7702